MKFYKGVTQDDIPSGAGSYVEENHDGGEVYNFVPIRGNYYGYARIQNGRSLRIEKLGAGKESPSLSNVTVILFAKNPETGGQYIIGWYRNAVLFRQVRRLSNSKIPNKSYNIKASIKSSYLVPADDRTFVVEGPGQTNAWYVEDYVDKTYIDNLEAYLSDPEKPYQKSCRQKNGRKTMAKRY
jgi:hypothetical protein